MKKTIAIIFGGKSSEYSVSLESTYSVLSHLDRKKYDVYMIGITKKGEWKHFDGEMKLIEQDQWYHYSLNTVMIGLDPNSHCLLEVIDNQIVSIPIDAILPILHGKNGEDGTIQGIIQMSGIPLVGCDVLSSALCMDKYRAHQLVESYGIKVPKSIYLSHQDDYIKHRKDILNLKLPLYIKPIRSGSSLGICRIENFDDLDEALKYAFQYDNQVLIEEEIKGFEVGCAVMGIHDLQVGRVDEIELTKGFFNFKEKYTLETSNIHVPARIDNQLEKRIQETAKKIYRILGCQVFARVDMFLTPDEDIVFNEVNTIPGFTAHSRYPSMMKAAGISFTELLSELIEMGINYANENNLSR